MNIITNNCLGGHIYRDVLKIQYKNPFIWCFIEPFFVFIKDYSNINFRNYRLEKLNGKLERFKIVIEDKYELKFWHYWFDKNCEILTIKDRDVYYNKIWEYIVEKYEERLSRMNPDDIRVFAYYNNDLTLEQFEVLKNLSKNNKVLVFNNKFNFENPNMKCFTIDENWVEPKCVIDTYSKQIQEFLC